MVTEARQLPATSPRLVAARLLTRLLTRGESLTQVEQDLQQTGLPDRDAAFCRRLLFDTLRWLPRLQGFLTHLLQKPLKQRDADIRALLLIGLCQLDRLATPAHAAVGATAEEARALGKPWAVGLINAILRRYDRERDRLEADCQDNWVFSHAHPDWLLSRFKADWGKLWPAIAAAGNGEPPMSLRVNLSRTSREQQQAILGEAGVACTADPFTASGLTLESPCAVSALPGFADGLLSVQDCSAQLSAELLAPQPGERVLDACAAPGGKTAHLLESASDLDLLALDQDAGRLERVAENLERLSLTATLLAADAANTDDWWDGQPFDAILLDAPCSGTGVIRRHPDIKLLRRAEDIATLAQQQQRLLDALWPTLRPGGRLLYATCAITTDENANQIATFIERHSDARAVAIDADWGRTSGAGRQLLPGVDGDGRQDGFYYALLERQS